jgi:hypothetical protein
VLQGRLHKLTVYSSQRPLCRSLHRLLGDFEHITTAGVGSLEEMTGHGYTVR